ncbi:MAG: hemerythrin domain-containing protein [Myxococcaceae bacterium]
MTLTDTLSTQHRLLEQLAGEMHVALKANDAAKASEVLTKFRDALMAHLKLESASFYPPMLQLAGKPGNEAKLRTIQLFADNMKIIAGGLTTFFDRYVGKPLELNAFRNDWGTSLKILAQRIESEESTLHPLFEQLQKAAA